MRDELTQLLDAWGRREASGKAAVLPAIGPSAGFLAAARRARLQRFALRAALVVGLLAAIAFLLVMSMRSATTPSAPAAAPSRAIEP